MKKARNKAKECTILVREQFSKVFGEVIKSPKVALCFIMAMSLMELTKIIFVSREFITTKMEMSTRDFGKTTLNMEKVN